MDVPKWLEEYKAQEKSIGEMQVDVKKQLAAVHEVEGALPEELKGGELFRAGPGRFERGDQRYSHVLDGDGFILKFEFPSSEEGKTAVVKR